MPAKKSPNPPTQIVHVMFVLAKFVIVVLLANVQAAIVVLPTIAKLLSRLERGGYFFETYLTQNKMKAPNKTIEYFFEAGTFNWEIAPGKVIEAWGINKQLPAPTIRANIGDEVIINVKNNLEEPTMLHWHGIQLPAEMYGTDITQKPILHGETFQYRFLGNNFYITLSLSPRSTYQFNSIKHSPFNN